MIDLTHYDVVFLDIGNVIFHDTPVESYFYFNIFKKLNAKRGLDIEDFFQCWQEQKKNNQYDWYKVLFRTSMEERFVTEFAWRKVLHEWDKLIFPIDGSIEFLKKLSQKNKLAIIANQPILIRESLDKYRVTALMDQILLDCEYDIPKPDARLFQEALKRTNTTPERSIMVGDRIDNDILPAHLLGFDTVWIKYNAPQLLLTHEQLSEEWQNRHNQIITERTNLNEAFLAEKKLEPTYTVARICDLSV